MKNSSHFQNRMALFLGLFFSVAFAQAAPPPTTKPPVWMMPPQLQELFDHPDQWAQTRSKITGIGCADHGLGKISDADLRAWATALKAWNLKFCLEVGAVKPWGQTGAAAFNGEHRFWDKFINAGGTLDTIAMDEPLCCTRSLHKPDDYAVEETAQFIKLARAQYPNLHIGDIEAYPSLSYEDLTAWIDALQAKLQSMNVKGIEFFRLDVNWVHFVINDKIGHGGWPEVKKLELFCRSRHIPFSLIYWAADLPALRNRGIADDSTWYISTLQQGNDYALVDGAPDEIALISWVRAPSHTVPETDPWTFTRSVLDFCNMFVK